MPDLNGWLQVTPDGSTAYTAVAVNDAVQPSRTRLNFAGANVHVVDDPVTQSTDVTIDMGGDGSGGYFVSDSPSSTGQVLIERVSFTTQATATFGIDVTKIGTYDSIDRWITIDGSDASIDNRRLTLGTGGSESVVEIGGSGGKGLRLLSPWRARPSVVSAGGATTSISIDTSNVLEITLTASGGTLSFVGGLAGQSCLVRLKRSGANYTATISGVTWRGETSAHGLFSTTSGSVDTFRIDVDQAGVRYASAWQRGDDAERRIYSPATVTISPGGVDAFAFTTSALTASVAIVAHDLQVTDGGLTFAAGATATIQQAQAAGSPSPMTLTAAQAGVGSGATLLLQTGQGTLPGTDASGDFQVDLRESAASVSSKLSLLVDGGSICDVSQSSSGVTTIDAGARDLHVSGGTVSIGADTLAVISAATGGIELRPGATSGDQTVTIYGAGGVEALEILSDPAGPSSIVWAAGATSVDLKQADFATASAVAGQIAITGAKATQHDATAGLVVVAGGDAEGTNGHAGGALIYGGEATGTNSVGGDITIELGPGTLTNGKLKLVGFATETSATTGAATALPANPVGYVHVTINGSVRVMPYYDPPAP